MRVLLTGATGYIGGRLVPRLLQRGQEVRVLVRDPSRVAGRSWASGVEVLRGDLLKPETLDGACEGIDAAYYLIHSMSTGADFARRDRRAVKNFCAVAAGVGHIVYLGGLLPPAKPISMHLQSRAEIGRILAEHVPSTELRAGPIIGSGSASFEMLRYLTERLPLMIAPHWVLKKIQPIAVRDVLSYLIAALERGPSGVVEIGADPLTYKEMIQTYARVRGLKRLVISVPALVPARIGARIIGIVTPIPGALAVPLVEGMSQPLLVKGRRAHELFPQVKPMPYETAVRLALERIQEQAVETIWSGALADAATYEYEDVRGLVREVRSLHVEASPDEVFLAFSSLGGDRGWLTWNGVWRARGLIDRVLGGPGLRRGRRHPEELLPGEAVDFWRVAAVEAPHVLRLRAELRLPGRAWLEWTTMPEGEGTRLTQIASFVPHGLPGALYWYLLYPFHRLIFTAMIREVAATARRGPQGAASCTTSRRRHHGNGGLFSYRRDRRSRTQVIDRRD